MADQPAAVTERPSGAYVSVKQDGFEIQSNTGTEDDLRAELGAPEVPAAVDAATGQTTPTSVSRKRQTPYQRMLDATAKEATAKRERDEAKAEADRLKAELEASKKRAPPVETPKPQPQQPAPVPQSAQAAAIAADPDPAPRIEDFAKEADPYTAWVLATAAHTSRQEFRRLSNESAQQRAAFEEHQTWLGRMAKVPDFQARFRPDTPIDLRIQPFIKRHEQGPELALYLSEHPDEAQRLTTLHPVDQIGRIGEIAGELKAEAKARTTAAAASGPASKPAPVSQAKPPIKPLGATPATVADGPPGEDASESEHEAYWAKRRRQYR